MLEISHLTITYIKDYKQIVCDNEQLTKKQHKKAQQIAEL